MEEFKELIENPKDLRNIELGTFQYLLLRNIIKCFFILNDENLVIICTCLSENIFSIETFFLLE